MVFVLRRVIAGLLIIEWLYSLPAPERLLFPNNIKVGSTFVEYCMCEFRLVTAVCCCFGWHVTLLSLLIGVLLGRGRYF